MVFSYNMFSRDWGEVIQLWCPAVCFSWPIILLLHSFSKSLHNFFALCQVRVSIGLNQWHTLSALSSDVLYVHREFSNWSRWLPFSLLETFTLCFSCVSEDTLGTNQQSLMESEDRIWSTGCFLSLDTFKSFTECYKMLLCGICAVLCGVIQVVKLISWSSEISQHASIVLAVLTHL